ncbi:hypothetical protein CEXT_397251 [Caerostris extrusa]|uniref:Uncharacterized protein n=1 Tax=Caerostris extrusa TaxID=172846 RepID=A0AAV4XEF0_CAEEX|nr:hypothetical protein CEXT_397251 [Caerostris extrusa]
MGDMEGVQRTHSGTDPGAHQQILICLFISNDWKRKFNVIHHRTDSPENVYRHYQLSTLEQTALFENTLSWNPPHLLCSVVNPPHPLFLV